MIKSEKIKKALNTLDNITIPQIMKDFNVIKNGKILSESKFFEDADPNDLVLDAVIEVSQELKNQTIKKLQFNVCDKWLKPSNVFSVVQKGKDKIDGNVWILFYDSNMWYVRKGLKAPSTVHVQIISVPEERIEE